MPRRFIRLITHRLSGLALAVMTGVVPVQAETVTVFAAASLKAALDDIAAQFEQSFDHRLQMSFAGSSALARQIERGAPAHVFISANTNWMDALEAQSLLEPHSRMDVVSNELVLIAPADTDHAPVPFDAPKLLRLLGNGPLAMAFADAVPAGVYGKEALVTLGLWDIVSPRVAQADSVRGALALVARAEAPLGIVYATDAIAQPRVKVVATFPQHSHAPIIYPAAIIAPATDGAQAFAHYLQSAEARAIFETHGFGGIAP